MALHQLIGIRIGVPAPSDLDCFYRRSDSSGAPRRALLNHWIDDVFAGLNKEK